MSKGRNHFALFFVIGLVVVYCVSCSQDESIAGKSEAEKTEAKSTEVKAAPEAEVQEEAVGKVEAQSIEAQAEADNNHPPIEPGFPVLTAMKSSLMPIPRQHKTGYMRKLRVRKRMKV